MARAKKTTYSAVYCKDCKKTHYYKFPSTKESRVRGAMTCPECNKEETDRILACNYTYLGNKTGNKGGWTCDLDDSNIDDVDVLIGAVGKMGL